MEGLATYLKINSASLQIPGCILTCGHPNVQISLKLTRLCVPQGFEREHGLSNCTDSGARLSFAIYHRQKLPLVLLSVFLLVLLGCPFRCGHLSIRRAHLLPQPGVDYLRLITARSWNSAESAPWTDALHLREPEKRWSRTSPMCFLPCSTQT